MYVCVRVCVHIYSIVSHRIASYRAVFVVAWQAGMLVRGFPHFPVFPSQAFPRPVLIRSSCLASSIYVKSSTDFWRTSSISSWFSYKNAYFSFLPISIVRVIHSTSAKEQQTYQNREKKPTPPRHSLQASLPGIVQQKPCLEIKDKTSENDP